MAVRRDSFCSEALALIPEDEIEVGELIGAGSYGMVFKGHYHGALVALKQLIAERTDPTRAVTEYSDVRCVCVRSVLCCVQRQLMTLWPHPPAVPRGVAVE